MSMRPCRRADLKAVLVVLVLVTVAGTGVPHARADTPQSGGRALPPPTKLLSQVSGADRRRWLDAIAIANRSTAVRSQRARYPGLRSTSFQLVAHCRVDVWYATNGHNRAMVRVNLRNGRVLQQWTGWQSDWQMARGCPGLFGRVWNSPWLLVPLGALFLLPFFDWRRPFRLLHLDLLVLLAFGVSHVFFNRGSIGWSVPLVYPVLAYLLVRMLVVAIRPRPAPAGQRLVPLVPATWLVVGAVAVFCGRVVLNAVDSNVLDVGYAGVIGAHHIEHGSPLYDGHFALSNNTNDAFVSMIVVFALLAVSTAPVRGALIGLGAAAKFAPLALAPMFANPNDERRLRGPLLFTAVLILVLVASIVPFLP